jgi:hypothetical protein
MKINSPEDALSALNGLTESYDKILDAAQAVMQYLAEVSPMWIDYDPEDPRGYLALEGSLKANMMDKSAQQSLKYAVACMGQIRQIQGGGK